MKHTLNEFVEGAQGLNLRVAVASAHDTEVVEALLAARRVAGSATTYDQVPVAAWWKGKTSGAGAGSVWVPASLMAAIF